MSEPSDKKAPSWGLIKKAIVYGSTVVAFYALESLAWVLIALSIWKFCTGHTDVATLFGVWAVFCYVGRDEREDCILGEHYKFRNEVKKEIPLDD